MSTRPKNKSTSQEVLLFLERCLPLRASDVAFGSDVHCVSDVSPCGEVAYLITPQRAFSCGLMIYKAYRFDDIPQQVADDIHALRRDLLRTPLHSPQFCGIMKQRKAVLICK